jgi:preprotein translocase subunit YajC
VNGGSLIFLVAMFALLWLLLIRPQRQKQARQQRMLSSVKPGDEVLTVGGLYGLVVEVEDDDDLVVEIAEGIHVRVARRAVADVVPPDEEDEAGETEEAEVEDEIAAEADVADDDLVTVPEEDASLEATQRRLQGDD